MSSTFCLVLSFHFEKEMQAPVAAQKISTFIYGFCTMS